MILEPPSRQRAFEETLKPMGGGWCCVEPPKRGAHMHYWYDMLWDLPHTDRWGKRWEGRDHEGRWRPMPGP